MRVFLATSIEEVREIAAPSTSDWSRRDDEMSRRALCWLKSFCVLTSSIARSRAMCGRGEEVGSIEQQTSAAAEVA
jgi:hypothetical protein